MAELRVLHVVPRFHDGGPTASLLAEQRHGRRLGLDHDTQVLALEPGGSRNLVLQAMRQRLRLHVAPDPAREAELLTGADVVVVDWWNTPSMWSFLHRHRGRALRWILHCRVNGLHRPQQLPAALAQAPTHLVLTSPDLVGARTDGAVSVITDVLDLPEAPLPAAAGRLVHVGTVNVAKLDPAAVDVHRAALEAGAQVALLGSGGDEQRFRQRAADLGLAEAVTVPGFVSPVEPWLEAAAFVAPTSPFTYASCDKTVQEAQLRGLPVLTYADSPISHLVDGATGWLARDREHYAVLAAAVAGGELALPRAEVAAAARTQHGPDPKVRALAEVYRRVAAAEPRPVDDGSATVSEWVRQQTGGAIPEAARRPDLAALIADDDLLAAHLRWGCEGGLAQFLAAFGAEALEEDC